MALKPAILCSTSAVALLLCAPAQAQQQSGGTAGQPQDQQEQPSDGTPARNAGDATTADQPGGNVNDSISADQPAVGQEEEIVVTGVRASLVGALNVKREAVQVVDSIVSEDVGKLPDNNVVEALQRVTGVQVTDRAGGEAAGVSIRGLTDPLTTLNGRNIFTAAGQSFALQDVPANLVKRIDVYKTRAAEQIETGLAGQIDVQTRRPFDFEGFAVSGVARGIYNEQADTFNPNVSALISDRWETGIGDVGALINVSYARTKYRDMTVTAGAQVPFVTENPPAGYSPLQRVFPDSGAWQPGTDRGLPTEAGSTFLLNGQQVPYYLSRDAVFSSDLYGKRERPAVNAALQWAPNSSSEYTFEFLYSGFRGNTFNSLMFSFVDWWGALGNNPASTFELYPGTNIIKSRFAGDVFGFNSGDFGTNKTDSFVYALNGKWDVGENGRIVADLSYQTSKNATTFIALRTTRVADGINVDFNAGDGIPAYHFLDDSKLTDPAQWTIGEFYDNANRTEGDAITLHLDGDYRWDEGFVRQVKAGIRYDDRGAGSWVRTQDAPPLNRPFSQLDPSFYFTNEDFFDGRADVPTSWVLANGYTLARDADTIRALYRNSVDPGILLSDELTLARVFDINEINMAAYIQADTEISVFGRPLQTQVGVRYVDVDTDVSFTDRITGVTTDASNGTHRFLPAVTVRYEPFDGVRLRFNYGETLRRPAFGDLNPYPTLTGDLTNVGYGSGTRGNPDLQPTVSKNYDLSLEWYFERDSAIYGTLFRREIEGLVVPITSLVTITGSGLNTDRFLLTRPENASNGVLEGAEIGFVFFPDFLPGFLNGLGAQGSFTFLDSSQNIPEVDINGNVVGQNESAFFGVSDFSYNLTLAYDRGPVAARLSYVWRKEFLRNNEARLFANPIGVWRRPEKSLDFQLTYNVTDRIGVTFDAVNLTNETQQTYYQFEDAGGPETMNLGTTLLARTFALGVRFAFD